MSKRRKILFLLAGLALAVGAYIIFFPDNEPTYKGRKLSYWVEALNDTDSAGHQEAPQAIGQMGGKAVPYLLQWIQYETPAWKQGYDSFRRDHLSVLPHLDAKRDRAWSAADAFRFVGPEGKEALPFVLPFVLVLLRRDGTESSYRAVNALAGLGPDALPPLMAGLTNADCLLRNQCIWAIRGFAGDATPALPLLLQCLKDPEYVVRCSSAHALGHLKLQPAIAVPGLKNALQDSNSSVTVAAAQALLEFQMEKAVAIKAVQRGLKDPSPIVRRDATNILRLHAPESLTNALRATVP
jgi:hypothetical protein